MSKKELVLVVSRAFALLLIAWGFVEITYLPDRVFALVHHLSDRSALLTYDYWTRYYLFLTVFTVLRILAMFMAAALFWRCGPRVEAFFSLPSINNE